VGDVIANTGSGDSNSHFLVSFTPDSPEYFYLGVPSYSSQKGLTASFYQANYGGATSTNVSGFFERGLAYAVLSTYKQNGTSTLWANGKQLASVAAGTQPLNGGALTPGLLLASSGSLGANNCTLTMVWRRELSVDERKSVTEQPNQIFKPEEITIWVPGETSPEVLLAAAGEAQTSSSAALTTAITQAANTSSAPGSTASLTTALQLQAITGARPASSAPLTTAINLASDTGAKPSSSATLAVSSAAWAATSSAAPSSSASLSTSITFASDTSADAAAEADNLLTVIKLSSSVAVQPSSAAALSTQSRPACESVAQTLSAAHLTTQILLAAAGKAAPASWATLGPAQAGQDFTGMRLGVSIRPGRGAHVSGQRLAAVTSGPRIGCRVTSRF